MFSEGSLWKQTLGPCRRKHRDRPRCSAPRPSLCISFLGDLPADVTHCSFAWERGSKLFVSEAEPVSKATHAVFWKQYLRQVRLFGSVSRCRGARSAAAALQATVQSDELWYSWQPNSPD